MLIQSGFTHFSQKREEHRFFPQDRQLPSRIVVLDGDGAITFDALEWLSVQNVPLVQINWRGEVVSIGSSMTTALHMLLHGELMQGGFSFKLSEDLRRPRVQIRHASSRQSFIQFATTFGHRTTRCSRKKGRIEPVRRGYFVDIKTLAAALTSRSHSLASLDKVLGVESQKNETEEHGRALTVDYIDYAVCDTQTTRECFVALKDIYTLHGLIAANHPISESPLWFTLADCISAKLLTKGNVPHIVQAITFTPKEMQNELKPINIVGNDAYRVDPCEGDFFNGLLICVAV